MALNELWFLLIAVLFTGFFILEGFDFGVGMASSIIAKGDLQKRVLINTIGPFWDANEVWLITAAGAMFAAFPHWYSTMFSGFYVPLTLVLLALIGRGVAFEFRSKLSGIGWRKTWDAAIAFGSFAPPLLFGVMFAAMIQGVPIAESMEMKAGWADIVNGYNVWAGLSIMGLCLLQGLTFLLLRTTEELRDRARHAAKLVLPLVAVCLAVLAVWTYFATDFLTERTVLFIGFIFIGILAVVLSGWFIRNKKDGWAFAMTCLLTAVVIGSIFAGLFPRVMVSSIDSAFDLTVYNASSSSYTLKSMTIVTVILLPFVLAYQAWSYFVFHKRVTEKEHLEY